MNQTETRTYPATRKAGPLSVTLRYMTADDKQDFLAFARALPEHDLLYLRRDITEERSVDSWLREIAAGRTTVLLAVVDGVIAGYASVSRETAPWMDHVGVLRVMVADFVRRVGVGRILTQEAFAIALAQGIEKMVAQMMLDQRDAIDIFEEMGFRAEALLRDHVKDRAGEKHDMVLLSHDVAKFAAQLTAYGVPQAVGA